MLYLPGTMTASRDVGGVIFYYCNLKLVVILRVKNTYASVFVSYLLIETKRANFDEFHIYHITGTNHVVFSLAQLPP